MSAVLRIAGRIANFASAEFLLKYQANGGAVVVLRSMWTSVFIFLAYIGLKHLLDPERTLTFSPAEFRREIFESLDALGALWAWAYAALYVRFASQWAYLASLYNEIVRTSIETDVSASPERQKLLDEWIASFIEDAEDLHLATKRMFVPAIRHWLENEGVKQAFIDGAQGGNVRYEALRKCVEDAFDRQSKLHTSEA